MKCLIKKDVVLSALFSVLLLFGWVTVNAQSTEFTYQGRLLDSSMPPTGSYDFQFSLWDTLADGTQVGTTQTVTGVAVTGGIFTVKLDFGTTAFSDGGTRFLEIEVKPASGGTYTTLAPRQAMTSTPYSMRSLSTATADSLSAQCVNCVTSAQIESIDGGQITGTLPVTTVPTGSDNYIQNTSVPRAGKVVGQPAASLNIGGNATVGSLTVQTGTGFYGWTHTDGTTNIGSYVGSSTSGAAGGWLGTLSNHPFHLFTNSGQPSLSIDTAGRVGIGTFSPAAKFDIAASGDGAELLRFTTERPWVFKQAYSGSVSALRLQSTVGLKNFEITTSTGANVATFLTDDANPRVGIGTINPLAGTALHVIGTTRSSVVEITGGSDLAEKFEFSEEVKPGMVVAIDARNAGKLNLARGVYNRQVAGIISGANNLSAGMVLPDVKNSVNVLPVALSGRVWVYCDAGRRAIRPGDLLTTSATPGHAMKVSNYSRAQGAIIGKAMTSLKTGRGMVLVLVTLQ